MRVSIGLKPSVAQEGGGGRRRNQGTFIRIQLEPRLETSTRTEETSLNRLYRGYLLFTRPTRKARLNGLCQPDYITWAETSHPHLGLVSEWVRPVVIPKIFQISPLGRFCSFTVQALKGVGIIALTRLWFCSSWIYNRRQFWRNCRAPFMPPRAKLASAMSSVSPMPKSASAMKSRLLWMVKPSTSTMYES